MRRHALCLALSATVLALPRPRRATALRVRGGGPVDGALAYHARRLRTVQAYQTLSRALTPCFQAQYGGWARDLVFTTGLRIPGVAWLMKRSLAEPPARNVAHAATPASEETQA